MISAIQSNMIMQRQIKFKGNEQTRAAAEKANRNWEAKRDECERFRRSHSPEEIMTNENLYNEHRRLANEVGLAYSQKARAEYVDKNDSYPNGDYFYHTH